MASNQSNELRFAKWLTGCWTLQIGTANLDDTVWTVVIQRDHADDASIISEHHRANSAKAATVCYCCRGASRSMADKRDEQWPRRLPMNNHGL